MGAVSVMCKERWRPRPRQPGNQTRRPTLLEWAGCTKEMIREAVGAPPPKARRILKQEQVTNMAAPGLLGLPITRDALRDLTKFDIRTFPRVAMLQQAGTQRWVLSATDSGGCRPAMGHAVAFVALQSATKYRTQRIDTPYINSIHRTVVASALVRFEIFRMESTCDLLVSLHWIEPQGGNAKPSHRWQNLFNQQRGSLEVPLWEDSHLALRDVVMPKFFTRAAEK